MKTKKKSRKNPASKIEQIIAKYGPKIRAILTKTRTAFKAVGYVGGPPYLLDGGEFRVWLTVRLSETADEEDACDIYITILESEESDGSKGGVAFSLDIVDYGGSSVGGLTPYNYSGELWVPRNDPAAVQERWEEFSAAVVPKKIVKTVEENWAPNK